MNRYGVPAVFRTRKQRWEDRPWQDRQWLIHKHGSAQFLKGTARECKGVEPDSSNADWAVLVALLGMFFACLVWGLL